jgi:tRNA G18 (ribose-2'-O)-methylase SpoU
MTESSIRRVLSLDLEELAPYRTLKRPMDHARAGIFVAEGEKVVRRLLDSGLTVHSLLLNPDWLARLESSGHLQGRDDIRIFLAEDALLREIVGFNIHQGIMAVAAIPKQMSLEELPGAHLVVALDGLRISENVGVIVRNCSAFGVDAIVAGETSCSPYVRRAVRNSMGTVFKTPVIHVPHLAGALRRLQTCFGTRVVAADLRGAASIYDLPLTGNVCIVLGNEDEGVSAEVLGLADARVLIPMHKETDSLNVASASAIFLFEVNRQRSFSGSQA